MQKAKILIMAPVTVETVTTMLASLDLKEMMAGLPVDWDKIPDKLIVLKMAVHCAINGPVGINKMTTFPTMGNTQMSIKSKLGQSASNSGWRQLVAVVAAAINAAQPALDCARRRAKGNLWPLAE
jgi:hypothetical protein